MIRSLPFFAMVSAASLADNSISEVPLIVSMCQKGIVNDAIQTWTKNCNTLCQDYFDQPILCVQPVETSDDLIQCVVHWHPIQCQAVEDTFEDTFGGDFEEQDKCPERHTREPPYLHPNIVGCRAGIVGTIDGLDRREACRELCDYFYSQPHFCPVSPDNAELLVDCVVALLEQCARAPVPPEEPIAMNKRCRDSVRNTKNPAWSSLCKRRCSQYIAHPDLEFADGYYLADYVLANHCTCERGPWGTFTANAGL